MTTSFLALPCKIRAGQAQATVRALSREELATQAFYRSSETKGAPVCQLTGSMLYKRWTTVKDTRGQQIGLTRRGKGSKLMLVVDHRGVAHRRVSCQCPAGGGEAGRACPGDGEGTQALRNQTLYSSSMG
jgi:hypothetical protein